MEKTVLSQEELTNLTELQKQQNDFVLQLGQIEYQISTLEKFKQDLKQNLKEEVTAHYSLMMEKEVELLIPILNSLFLVLRLLRKDTVNGKD